jgi:hypothetical protein
VYEPSIITHRLFVMGKGSFEILSNFLGSVTISFFDLMCLTIFLFEKPIMIFLGLKIIVEPSKC